MNELDKLTQQVTSFQEPRPLVLRSRTFKRKAQYGTVVRRAMTRNFDYECEVEHIEMSCPHLNWCDETGPVWTHKVDKDNDDE